MDNLQIDTMNQAEFDPLAPKNSRSKVDYQAIADNIKAERAQFAGKAISLVDFREKFWVPFTDKKKGHILWALKNVNAASVVTKLVTIRYQGSDAGVLIKPAPKTK